MKEEKKSQMSHIIEVVDVVEANDLINNGGYRLERFSESKGCYILVKRVR